MSGPRARLAVFAMLGAAIVAPAQIQEGSQTAAAGSDTAPSPSIDVPVNKDWTDTGIDLHRGDSVVLTASGTVTLPPQGRNGVAKPVGPEGQPRGYRDLIKTYPLNSAGFGALLGRIGSNEAAEPFTVGMRREMQVLRPGRLFLGPNVGKNDALTGGFQVTIAFTARGSETPVVVDESKLPEVTQEMIDRVPRRVVDADWQRGRQHKLRGCRQ